MTTIAKLFAGAALFVGSAFAQTTATCDVPLDNSVSVEVHNGIFHIEHYTDLSL